MYPALLVALSDPSDPKDPSGLTRWYEQVQIPFFLGLPGTRRITRYRSADLQPTASVTPQQFLALYDLEFESPAGLTDYATRQATALQQKRIGRFSPGADALNADTLRGAYYEQIGRSGTADAPQAVLMAYADPPNGEAAQAFSTWLGGQHVREAQSTPGVLCAAAHRFTHPNTGKPPPPWVVEQRYLVVYGLQAQGQAALDAARALTGLRGAALQLHGAALQLYERVSEPREPGSPQ
jgi:hypothetical protein